MKPELSNPITASAAIAISEWAYQPPTRLRGYPRQCYYRGERIAVHSGGSITIFRFDTLPDLEVTVEVPAGRLRVYMSGEQVRVLRDALNDALVDIAELEANNERCERFAAICNEIDNANSNGTQVHTRYVHPDVYYVSSPGDVAAKRQELAVAGVPRYLVLVDPADDVPR